jgi:hypothetical protein
MAQTWETRQRQSVLEAQNEFPNSWGWPSRSSSGPSGFAGAGSCIRDDVDCESIDGATGCSETEHGEAKVRA